MGRICPILNHPLRDGVLVDDDALVCFIQKKNLDFLPNELVCRSCKREVIKLYNKKLKRAIELRKSRFHASSVSSLKTRRTSSNPSITTERSLSQRVLLQVTQNGRNSSTSTLIHQLNGSKTNSAAQTNRNILSENQNNHTISEGYKDKSNVTIRKKTIKDYLTFPHVNTTKQISPKVQGPVNQNPHAIVSNINNEDDVIRRLSQEPTTSKGEKGNKRRLVATVDSDDDDDERLSLNAMNGTRLPHIQPIPPKHKPKPDSRNTLARDIMDEYIKDITGG